MHVYVKKQLYPTSMGLGDSECERGESEEGADKRSCDWVCFTGSLSCEGRANSIDCEYFAGDFALWAGRPGGGGAMSGLGGRIWGFGGGDFVPEERWEPEADNAEEFEEAWLMGGESDLDEAAPCWIERE